MRKRWLAVALAFCTFAASVGGNGTIAYASETTQPQAVAAEGEADTAEFVIQDGVLTGYHGAGGEVIIPDTVTSITNKAFYGNDNIVSVYIPDTVTSIQRESFRFCQQLQSVRLPEGLTEIGVGLFQYCPRLSKIQIPDTVTWIGANAFDFCYEMKQIVLPQGVTTIGEEAFAQIENLEAVWIPDTVTSIGTNAITNENAVIVGAAGSAAEAFAQKWGIPFAQAGTEASVTIQTEGNGTMTVRKEGQEISAGRHTLHVGDEITVSTSYTASGQIVLANGKDLTNTKAKLHGWHSSTVNLAQDPLEDRSFMITGDTVLQAQFPTLESADQVLNAEGSNLQFTVSGQDTFEMVAWMGRTAMQSGGNSACVAQISTTATGPGYLLFDYLADLSYYDSFSLLVDGQEIQSYDTVSDWKSEVCTLEEGEHEIIWLLWKQDEEARVWLDQIQVTADPSAVPAEEITLDKEYLDLRIGESGELQASILPQQATGKEVVWTSSNEEAAVVSDGVVTGTGRGKAVITAEVDGKKASCVVYVTQYELNGDFEMDGTVVKAYYGDSEKVVLPDGTTGIDSHAFQDHEEITEIDFGSSLTSIGAYAFSGCVGLRQLAIPDSVTEIGRNAFAYCEKLETLAIGTGITKLPHFVFFKAQKLKMAAIPAAVTEIDQNAFSKTEELILYCEKASAAYDYAILRGFRYCLVEGEILGEDFDAAPYTTISQEEAVSEEYREMLRYEIVVDADTEYTYYLSGTKLYRQDVARNVFDAECVYDTQQGTTYAWYVCGSIIYFASTRNGATTVKGYDVYKSQEVFTQTFPLANYSSQFVVDGEQNFYFVQNRKDIFIYDKDGNKKDEKVLSNASFLNGMDAISLVNASKNNRVVFAKYYSSGRALSYTEDYTFSSLSDVMAYPNYTRYYEGYQLVRDGQFIDTKYWIKNPGRTLSSSWRFFKNEAYAVNQYGEIAKFDWNAKKADSFDFEILYFVDKGGDYSKNASAYLDGNLYIYGSNGNIQTYNLKNQEITGHYELGEETEVMQLYVSDKTVYVRYKKDGVPYMAPLEMFDFAEKTQVIRSDHVTRTYGKEEVKQAYEDSLPETPYTSEESHYKVKPSAQAPYRAGELSEAVIADTLKRLNYARWQSGLNTLSLKTEYMQRSQKGAVLMKANNELTHYPSQPSDMDDDFYQEGYAGVNASADYSGNVSWGDSLVDSIFGYLDDVHNVEPNIGHRLSLLDKKADAVSFGFCGYYSALSMYYAEEEPENNETYYAWPSAGFFPSEALDTQAKWHIITDWTINKGLKVTFETEHNTYVTSEIYYDSSYSAFYFAPPKDMVNELTGGSRKFRDGSTVQVTLTGLIDELGNNIIVTYPVTFVAVSENGSQGGNGSGGSSGNQGNSGNQGGSTTVNGNQIGNDSEKPSSNGSTAQAEVTSVKITAANRPYGAKTLYAKKGSSINLKAYVSGKGKFAEGVTWSSSNKKVATVNSRTGKVKVVSAKGTAVITAVSAADSSKNAKITVKAVSKTKANKALKLKNKKVSFTAKGALAQIALKKYTKNTTEKLSYKVISGKKYVKVDKYGVVTCKAAPGKKAKAAKIQVSCGKRKAILSVKIVKK